MKQLILTTLFAISLKAIVAQVSYPSEVKYLSLVLENKSVKMAYMDIPAANPGAGNIVLLHGKNFSGYYWKNLIHFLNKMGYRVIVPDQPGWGYSVKPDLHYSFHLLAKSTATLLDSLHIQKTVLLGHSMGGMLAVRFSLLYPDRVEKMILEDPIGLEDYKTFVPYYTIDKVYEQERKATYGSYKKYQQGYYPEWKPEYEQYVRAQAEALKDPMFDSIAWVNAVTYDMIFQQPVIYELENIKVKVLLVTGEKDNTIVGKDKLSESEKAMHGNYNSLSKRAAGLIPDCEWIELKGIGHIPHIHDLTLFEKTILPFLK